MAYIHCNFGSSVLGMTTDMNVILPELDDKSKKRKFSTLYLLHGASDNYSNWMRSTAIERYAQEHEIAVVMPSADLSFYSDMKYGGAYYTHIGKELVEYTRMLFPLSDKKECTFIAGLSMGGYGSMRIGLSNPEVFSAAGSFSGALDLASISRTKADFLNSDTMKQLLFRVFGTEDSEELAGTEADLSTWLQKVGREQKQVLYQSCGQQDFLYEQNQNFLHKAEQAGVSVHYEEWTGDHEWKFWDESIQRFLNWLEEQKICKMRLEAE